VSNNIDELLEPAHIARLATVNPDTLQPHVIPVWYWWDGESVWISAFRSTRKVRELLRNPRCAFVVDGVGPGGAVWGVVLEGLAEVISEPREFVEQTAARVYLRYTGEDGVLTDEMRDWVHDPGNLLIRLKPAWSRTW
jgi:PPOX class probable F420-dependent enzyme